LTQSNALINFIQTNHFTFDSSTTNNNFKEYFFVTTKPNTN